jgi:hypothetical protein
VPGGDRNAGISIKSDRQVTASGFPESFVEIAWGQGLGPGPPRRIRDGSDGVVLVTGRLANQGTRERLLAAGATTGGDVTATPAGDEMTFLRDPWGLVLQFVRRATPLMG